MSIANTANAVYLFLDVVAYVGNVIEITFGKQVIGTRNRVNFRNAISFDQLVSNFISFTQVAF